MAVVQQNKFSQMLSDTVSKTVREVLQKHIQHRLVHDVARDLQVFGANGERIPLTVAHVQVAQNYDTITGHHMTDVSVRFMLANEFIEDNLRNYKVY